MSLRVRSLGFVVLLLSLGAGCRERRRPLSRGDGGPAVVMFDPTKTTRLAMPLVDEQEPDDDLPHAQPIEAGKGVRGTIGAPRSIGGKVVGDQDVYSWIADGAAPDGGFLEARIELTGIPELALALEVLDGDGKRLISVADGAAGEGEIIPNLSVEPGLTYYLRVKEAKRPSAHVPEAAARSSVVAAGSAAAYALTVRTDAAPAWEEREPNDDVAHATALPALSDASGFFGRRRDEDWLKLPVDSPSANGALTLKLELGPVDGVVPELRVVGADQSVVASARAARGDELRLRNVGVRSSAGGLWILLKAVEGKNTDVRWSLRARTEPPLDGVEVEPNNTAQQATPLTLRGGVGEVSGFLWPGDVDVYRVSASGAALIRVEVDGLERVDLKLEHVLPDGSVLVRADDGGVAVGEWLPPWPLVQGEALVRVSARPRDTAFDAPYHLTVRTVDDVDGTLEREPNDQSRTATPWKMGSPVMRGYVAPRGDQDLFRFVAPPAKTRATVRLEGPAGLTVAIADERSPLAGAAGRSATASIVSGAGYLVRVQGAAGKSAIAREPYVVGLDLE